MAEVIEPGGDGDAVTFGRSRLAGATRVLIALDFDGTLAPFHLDPGAVTMVPGATDVLAQIAADPRFALALVSGRPAAELVSLANPPAGTLVAGSHGSQRGEVTGAGLESAPLDLSEAELDLIRRVDDEFRMIVADSPGVWIEEKPLGRALHTRRAETEIAESATQRALAGVAAWPQVHALHGKSVVEIAVRHTTKADGLAWARGQVADAAGIEASQVAAVFAGDDTTDEFALASLGTGDLGIKVGAGDTAAQVRVADEASVVSYLAALLA